MRRIIFIAAVLVVGAAVIFFLHRPSTDRNWSPDQQVMPQALFRGDVVEIRGVRNFAYRSETEWTPRFENRSYDLRDLESVWFVVERFAGLPGVAHTFLSFGFSGSDYVAISVEIRKEKGEIYSPLKGLLRQYELMYVVADERDIIGLRTNHRRSEVYLYPVRTTPERMRRVFVDMLARANKLAVEPEFYNTLTSTCTTNIVRHVNTISPRRIPFSLKVVLPAYSDRLAYELDLIETRRPFEDVRAAHRIDPIAQRIGVSADFSERIREGSLPTSGTSRTRPKTAGRRAR